MAKKSVTRKKDDTRKLLEDQLKKLLKDVDNAGLVFLIEQANVLRHNMEIDRINQNIDEINKINNKNKSRGMKTKKGTESVYVEIIPDDDKKNFIFQIGNERKFITLAEMRTMVKISHGDEPATTIARRFYQWLYNERKDVLIDCHVRSKDSVIINDLIKIIKKKYKTK